MTAAVSSPADVVNLALSRIGHPRRIGHLYDGSNAAKKALDIYALTRDDLLREQDWECAERSASLTLLKGAPTGGYTPLSPWSSSDPPLPWAFEYAYPSDCLKLRSIRPQPLFIPNVDPGPNVFRIVNDTVSGSPTRVILCNVPLAIGVYTAQVTDPTTWDVGFIEAFVAALARRLAPQLGSVDQGKATAMQAEGQDEQRAVMVAADQHG